MKETSENTEKHAGVFMRSEGLRFLQAAHHIKIRVLY